MTETTSMQDYAQIHPQLRQQRRPCVLRAAIHFIFHNVLLYGHPLALTSDNGLYSLQPVRDTADQPYFPATGRSSSAAVSQNSAQKKAASKQKSADWTKEETEVLLQAWGPNYDRLKRASSKDRARIWSDIYANYKEHYFDGDRTLTQLKKRQQNLEHEFKSLKQRSQNIREEGFKKIKEGFPYYDYFDEIMGQRDSVDPSKMQIEST